MSFSRARVGSLTIAVVLCTEAWAASDEMPNPLTLAHVVSYAREHRAEIRAQLSRATAAQNRPRAVSALEDPVLSTSLDHLPFSLMGVDGSFTIEQRFPMSRLLRERWRAAEAGAKREQANVIRSTLDVELDAANAFFMLNERRQMRAVVEGQLDLARQFVSAAKARYAVGTGAQAELIRAETEVARLEGELSGLNADSKAAEAMLNASLNRSTEATIPPLQVTLSIDAPPIWNELQKSTERPELSAAKAEIARSESEVGVMRSMYAPMGMVRTGPAYTMFMGPGWMVMFGISPRHRGGPTGVYDASACQPGHANGDPARGRQGDSHRCQDRTRNA